MAQGQRLCEPAISKAQSVAAANEKVEAFMASQGC